jgi:hypothetical protein
MYLVYQLNETTMEWQGYGRYPVGGAGAPAGIGEPLPGSEQITANLIGVSKQSDANSAIEELGNAPGNFLAVEAKVVELSLRSY